MNYYKQSYLTLPIILLCILLHISCALAQKTSPTIDAVSPNKQKATIKFVITQGLFDYVEESIDPQFIIQLIETFQQRIPVLIDLGGLKLDLNITDTKLLSGNFFSKNTFVITNDNFIFDLNKFSAALNVSYEYLSDPPVFADFGNLTLNLENLSFYIKTTLNQTNQDNITFIVNNIRSELGKLDINMDGISDFSDVLTFMLKTSTFMGGTLGKGITSGDDFEFKFLKLINQAIGLVPDYIELPQLDDSYVFLNLTQGIKFQKDQFMEIPLFLELQSMNQSHQYIQQNNASIPGYKYQNGDAFLIYITEQLIDNLIIFAHHQGMLNLAPDTSNKDNQLKVGTLNLVFLNELSGFNTNGLCTFGIISTPEEVPQLDISKGFITFTSQIKVDVICQKNPKVDEYSHVIFLYTRISLTISLYGDGNSKIQGKANLAPISITQFSDSLFARKPNTNVLNSFGKILEPLINQVVNSILQKGIDLNTIITASLGTSVFQVQQLKIEIYQEYVMLNIKPKFNVVSNTEIIKLQSKKQMRQMYVDLRKYTKVNEDGIIEKDEM
ncbi:UNKNOWN [Stylonychia lemnae]|uniref:Lipid-binding serum glycoprotein C-terminal domain-containing protein n=1 Tax=Stylonychia lemnae TaxID=5949 RepID=A0A078BAZ3_STYLE|nr:UNKNOWN [Stylonychia lemnae]|eukprot:CDW90402.1 UNKNOWN [Stylonychia lemnae]